MRREDDGIAFLNATSVELFGCRTFYLFDSQESASLPT